MLGLDTAMRMWSIAVASVVKMNDEREQNKTVRAMAQANGKMRKAKRRIRSVLKPVTPSLQFSIPDLTHIFSLLHFLGDLDNGAASPLQYSLWGSALAVKRLASDAIRLDRTSPTLLAHIFHVTGESDDTLSIGV